MTLRATTENVGETWRVITLQDKNKTITLNPGEKLVVQYDALNDAGASRLDYQMSAKDILKVDSDYVSGGTTILDVFKPIKAGQITLKTKISKLPWYKSEEIQFTIDVVE